VRLGVWLFLCVVWGLSWVGIKLSLEGVPPFLGSGVRFAVAVPLLYAWARARNVPLGLDRQIWPVMLWSAFFNYGFSYGLVYWGEQYLTAGVTSILYATFPVFTAVFVARVLPDERIGWGAVAGLLTAFAGVVVTFSQDLSIDGVVGSQISAALAVVLGAAGGALSTVLIKWRLSHLHPVSLTLWQMILGSVGLLACGLALGEWRTVTWTPRSVLGILYLGIVASALAFTLYYWLLQRVPAVAVSCMIFVNPVVALLGDHWIYGSEVTSRMVLGMLLIFAGIGLSEFRAFRYGRRRVVTGLEPAETTAVDGTLLLGKEDPGGTSSRMAAEERASGSG